MPRLHPPGAIHARTGLHHHNLVRRQTQNLFGAKANILRLEVTGKVIGHFADALGKLAIEFLGRRHIEHILAQVQGVLRH